MEQEGVPCGQELISSEGKIEVGFNMNAPKTSREGVGQREKISKELAHR
jgi:hypothetical protein